MSEPSYSSQVDYGKAANSSESTNSSSLSSTQNAKGNYSRVGTSSANSTQSSQLSPSGSFGPSGGSGSSGSSGSYQKRGSSFFDLFFGDSGSSGGFTKAFEAGFSTPRSVALSVGQPQLQFDSFSMPNINVQTYGNGGRISVPSLSADDLEFDVPKLSSGGSSLGRSSSGGMGKMLLGVAALGVGVILWRKARKKIAV